METMEKVDAGAWRAGHPIARWSKCYPANMMHLHGEGPLDVSDRMVTPIVAKKRRNLKVLYSSLVFILLVVIISLMVVFFIEYEDSSMAGSSKTAITKNLNVVNTITFIEGNSTSNSTRAGGRAIDVGTVVHSLERTRWLSSAGRNPHFSARPQQGDAARNSSDGRAGESDEDIQITLTFTYREENGERYNTEKPEEVRSTLALAVRPEEATELNNTKTSGLVGFGREAPGLPSNESAGIFPSKNITSEMNETSTNNASDYNNTPETRELEGVMNQNTSNNPMFPVFYSFLPIFNRVYDTISQW